ncbi:AGAP006897-PA-like protein [Anopheles sinensis]|uniref:AGAP006897-PA-like protein n=1 Tax=Anopheles sinensis TaxID=74873 RepID=A0A084VDZ1_ANOSI|nr:AGAP006897-PA-like protein [Anopheles sinensis]
MVHNSNVSQAGSRYSYLWWFSATIILASVAIYSVEGAPDRSEFSRSLDALRVRGNQFVRGIPCEVACEFCGCEASRIGDKCVCFCPGDTKQSTECLTAVRKDELSSGIDNDILILTRSGARFARELRQSAVLRSRMGRGASVSWKNDKSARKGYVGNVQIFADRVLFCVVVGSLLAGLGDAHDGLIQLTAPGTVSPQQLCQDLCGECQCSGQLVGENVCQCNCDFPSASNGGSNCTVKVKRLCRQMDVECDFNGAEITYVRAPRGGCHTMSCYEKHHGHEEGGHEGYYGDDEEGGEYEEGYEHGGKELICCKGKKHKEKKHKLKKHHKKEKHNKFHIIIKGKIPEHSCHHHEEGDYGGGYEGHEGYRAVSPDHHQMRPVVSHQPMEVTVWKNGKKFPLKRPPQQHQQHQQHYSPPVAPHPESAPRGKSAEPPSQPPPPSEDHPQEQPPKESHPPPPPPEHEPPPQEPLTPPPNLYDGAPIPPHERPPTPHEPPKTPSHPKVPPPSSSFSRPAPPPPPSPSSHWQPAPPPPPPPMITVNPPPRRSFSEPSYSDCQFESYDLNYFHHSPYYQPREQYQTSKHYSDYQERPRYREHDDMSYDEDEGHGHVDHGVHPLSDNEVEDWPPPPERDPADLLAFNQIVSRQIWENERAILYSTPPFQPTPRPWRDEFEPPVAEIGAVQYESFGSGEKNYYMEHRPTPPEDAFIPPVPPPDSPVEFPTAEHAPHAYPANSEEAQYRQPTPPPHYVRMKNAGRLPSYGLDRPSYGLGGYRSAGQGASQRWSGTSHHGRISSSSRRF